VWFGIDGQGLASLQSAAQDASTAHQLRPMDYEGHDEDDNGQLRPS
jgi:hypothetical protein